MERKTEYERAESDDCDSFENNRDGYSNIKQQVETLKIALNLPS